MSIKFCFHKYKFQRYEATECKKKLYHWDIVSVRKCNKCSKVKRKTIISDSSDYEAMAALRWLRKNKPMG